MSVFGKNKGQDQTQKQAPAMSREQVLWKKYWSIAGKIDALVREQEAVKGEIVQAATDQALWRGKTAAFEGGNKVRARESVRLAIPKFFDAEAFMERYPQYAKLVPDEEKVRALLPNHEAELGKRVIDEAAVLARVQAGGEESDALTDMWGIGVVEKIAYTLERS